MNKLTTIIISAVLILAPLSLPQSAQASEFGGFINQAIQDLMADDHISGNTAAALLSFQATGNLSEESDQLTNEQLSEQIQELQSVIAYLQMQLDN